MVRPPPTLGGLRTVHNRLPLPYPIEEGVGDFLSPPALKIIAEDFQQGLLDRLNDEVKGKSARARSKAYSSYAHASVPISRATGTKLEQKSVVQTIINAAEDPQAVLTFNYASEALNNSFFLQSIVRISYS